MPAIIVPWAESADDHQTDNARILGDVGAAVVVAEPDLDAQRLAALVADLAADQDQLIAMGRAAFGAGDAHRSGRLVVSIEEVAARR